MQFDDKPTKVLHIPSLFGRLPEGWDWERLDDVCDGVFDCPHSTPPLAEVGPYVARSQDIRSGVFATDGAAHVSEATYRERIVRAEPVYGDLLYSREGTYFGIAAEVPANIKVCLGQRMVLIRPSPQRIQHRYLRYWLNSAILASHLHGLRDGSVAERLNLPTIRNLPVPLPPIGDQCAIAATLGALDDKIELNRRTNATLEAMARSLFQSWFVDFDPVRAKAEGRQPAGMGADTAALFPDSCEDSPIGEIPQGWKAGTLGDLCQITMGQSPPGESYNEVGDGIVFFQGTRDFGFRFPTPRVYCTAPTRLAQADDVLLSVRAPVGSLNVAADQCAIGRGLAALRMKRDHSGFLYYLLTATGQGWSKFDTDGTVFGSVSKNDINAFPCLLPDGATIRAFNALTNAGDSQIRHKERQSKTLAVMRDALLPKLLSGELRVGEAAAAL